MTVINAGSPAVTGSTIGSSTYTVLTSPASNGNGTIDTVQIYFGTGSVDNVKTGTFSGSGANWTNRDFANLGTIVGSGLQTFTGLSIDVALGDLMGCYHASGFVSYNASEGQQAPYASGVDYCDGGSHTFSEVTGYVRSIYGTGTGADSTPSKTINVRLGNLYAQNIQVLSPTGWTKGKIN